MESKFAVPAWDYPDDDDYDSEWEPPTEKKLTIREEQRGHGGDITFTTDEAGGVQIEKEERNNGGYGEEEEDI